MKNYLLLILIFISVLFLNIFPNYYGFLKTPPEMSFSGQASWFDPWDLNVYVGALKWGQDGHLLLQNNFTTISHPDSLIYPLYIFSGYLFPQTPSFLLFHLLAITGGLILLIIIWKLARIYLSPKISLLAVLLISLSGGLGWLFFPNLPSADLFMTGFTFTSHFQRAHEAVGIGLYLVSLNLFYLACLKKKFLFNIFSVLSAIFLIIFYPYYLLSYFLIGGGLAFFLLLKYQNKQPLIFLSLNLFLSLPFLICYWQTASNPGFGGVFNQELSKPGPLDLILGYGLLIPIYFWQLKNNQRENWWFFLNWWIIGSFLLFLLPLGFARFFLRSLFFPLVILNLLAIPQFARRFNISVKIIYLIFILFIPISSFYITYKRLTEVNNNNPWYYLTIDEKKALDYLNNLKKDQGVLSSYQMGNQIPAQTNQRVYFGHLLQTPNSSEKISNLGKFYANNLTDEEALKFLINHQIKFIYFGQEEKDVTKTAGKSEQLKYQFLKEAFKSGKIQIFYY